MKTLTITWQTAYIISPLADLANEEDTVRLCEVKVLIDDSLKELPTGKVLGHENYLTPALVSVHQADHKLTVEVLQHGHLPPAPLLLLPASSLYKGDQDDFSSEKGSLSP